MRVRSGVERRHRRAGQPQPQALPADGQHRAGGRQRHLLTGTQAAPADLQAVAAVAHLHLRQAVGPQGQRGVVGRHMRVVQHPGVVQRAAQRHRPGVHVQRAARPAVAVEQLDQREAGFGALGGDAGGVVQPKPSR